MYSELLGRNRNKGEGEWWMSVIMVAGAVSMMWVTLLGGKEYERFVPRGGAGISAAIRLIKWLKPSCMLVCEDNYSNAHGTPFVYKTLGISKLGALPLPGR